MKDDGPDSTCRQLADKDSMTGPSARAKMIIRF